MAARCKRVKHSMVRPRYRPFWGLSFDGDDYVHIPAGVLSGTGSFTAEAWVWKATSIDRTIVSEDKPAPGIYPAWRLHTSSFIVFSPDDSFKWLHISNSPAAEQWYHIAGVFDSSDLSMRVYYNGQLEVSGQLSSARKSSGQAIALGAEINSGNTASYHNGMLAVVRIWPVARTQEQIQADMHNPWATGPGLVAGYAMEPGSGQKLLDISGNGHHGQLGSEPGEDTGDPDWIGPYHICTNNGPL